MPRGRGLAAEGQLIAFKLGVFAGLAEESNHADQDLNGEEYDPDVHAIDKAWTVPNYNLLIPKDFVSKQGDAIPMRNSERVPFRDCWTILGQFAAIPGRGNLPGQSKLQLNDL